MKLKKETETESVREQDDEINGWAQDAEVTADWRRPQIGKRHDLFLVKYY